MCIKNHNHMIHVSWSMEWERQNFLTFWAIFWPFTTRPTNDPENQKLEMKKNAWRYHHFTYLHYKWQSIIWCMVPEIWSTTDRIFVILDCSLHFYPLKNPENQNFEKMKKTPGDIIILHVCTINDNHMMYGSWDMEVDGQNFLSFWTIFLHFYPLTTRKIKILKN